MLTVAILLTVKLGIQFLFLFVSHLGKIVRVVSGFILAMMMIFIWTGLLNVALIIFISAGIIASVNEVLTSDN